MFSPLRNAEFLMKSVLLFTVENSHRTFNRTSHYCTKKSKLGNSCYQNTVHQEIFSNMQQLVFVEIGTYLPRWHSAVGPTLADFANVGRIVSRFCHRWTNSCLPTTSQVRYLYILPTLGQRWIFIQDGGEQS